LPNVIRIRTLRLAGAVEVARIPGTPGKPAYDIFMDCFHKGVWVRPAGENIVICPPYIVEDAHIDQIVQTVADSIRRHA
jgi:beta-alanine--pyruvate transaminase